LIAMPTPGGRPGCSYWKPDPWLRSTIGGLSERDLVVERLALHGVLEAVDTRLDEPIDLLGGSIAKRRHQAKLGQGLGKETARVLDRALLHIGLVDQAAAPPGNGAAGSQAAYRAE